MGKKMYKNYHNLPIFEGIDSKDASSMLTCIGAKIRTYKKEQPIIFEGEKANLVGIVMSGKLQIFKDDYEGSTTIISNVFPGEMFGEAFAFAEVDKMPVSVFTLEESTVMFIDCNKVLTTCSNACQFHSKIIQNLLKIVSNKTLALNKRIEIISKRTTREKLICFLGMEYNNKKTLHFTIPFNRQQLADYLCVDRSALSAEMSKMKKEGIIDYKKNEFWLL